MTPTEVHLRQAERRLDITWDDGHTSQFALRYLRGYCPCASCQGHFSGTVTFIDAPADLVDVQPVGSYAMRFVWRDGHQSGLYAFEYLRRIEQVPPGDGPTNATLLAEAS